MNRFELAQCMKQQRRHITDSEYCQRKEHKVRAKGHKMGAFNSDQRRQEHIEERLAVQILACGTAAF